MPKKHCKRKCSKTKSNFPDIVVVEPSECDRSSSNQLEDLVEGCWLVSRPPPVLYDREPVVTARRTEVARYRISGDGEEPIYVRQKFTNCAKKDEPTTLPKFYERRVSLPTPKVNPRERFRSLERKSVL